MTSELKNLLDTDRWPSPSMSTSTYLKQYRWLFKVSMEANLRARTLGDARGFLKALVEVETDRILGFTAFGVSAGEVLTTVQVAMTAGLRYTALRDAILTHPTLARVDSFVFIDAFDPRIRNRSSTATWRSGLIKFTCLLKVK